MIELLGCVPLDPVFDVPHAIVKDLARMLRMPEPTLWLDDTPALNACAAGWSQYDAAVALTTDMLALPPPEIRAVLAHEFGHIRFGHTGLQLVKALHRLTRAAAVAGGAYAAAQVARVAGLFVPRAGLALTAASLLASAGARAAEARVQAEQRGLEMEADAFAIDDSGIHLAALLNRIAAPHASDPSQAWRQGMMFAPLFDLSDHPPTPLRIAQVLQRRPGLMPEPCSRCFRPGGACGCTPRPSTTCTRCGSQMAWYHRYCQACGGAPVVSHCRHCAEQTGASLNCDRCGRDLP